jgi:hypothetical protein
MSARWSTPEAVGVSRVRGKGAGGERGGRRALRVLSVTLAVVGGVLSVVAAKFLDLAGAMASEGDPPLWTTSERAYVWVWVLVGLTVLCGTWLLSRRPWAGVCLTVVAAAVLFLNVTLLRLTDFLAHFLLWCIVATPLLLAAGLGAWRALALRGDSGSSGGGAGDGASTDETE